jgi:hypothetical protein
VPDIHREDVDLHREPRIIIGIVDFDQFSKTAEAFVAKIPEEFLRGVTGIQVHRGEKSDPDHPGFLTMGECTDDQAAALTDPEALRSRLHVYYGSFVAIAREDPDFDWEGELRETILHELRHHIEDRAGILDLLREDAEFLAGSDPD